MIIAFVRRFGDSELSIKADQTLVLTAEPLPLRGIGVHPQKMISNRSV